MPASHNDSFTLSQDTALQGRIQASLIAACIAVATESPTTVPFHRERSKLAQSILAGINGVQAGWITLWANSVCTDATVLSDATAAGTVVITSANRAAQALLVTDAHIDAAISGQFNAFTVTPAN